MSRVLERNKDILSYKEKNVTKKDRKESCDNFNSLLSELNQVFNESSSIYEEYLDLYEGEDYAIYKPR